VASTPMPQSWSWDSGWQQSAGIPSAAFGTAKRLPFGPADASAGLNGSHV